jgi:heat shock protein HslJ
VLDPDRPLEGTRWVASVLIGGNVKAGNSPELSGVFLVFGQGRVTGSDGCELLSGPAAVSGTTINFGPGPAAASSPRTDPADPAADLALRVRATLQGDVNYRIEAGELTLTGTDREGRGIGLMLTAVSQPSPP